VGDDVNQLATGVVDMALHSCSIAAFEHGGDEIFDNFELALIVQHRPEVLHKLADHLNGRRRSARRIEEVTLEA
jgi:hypothetical protein